MLLLALALGLAGSAGDAYSAAVVPAGFTAATGGALAVGSLDLAAYTPATVSANRIDPSTCRVTWVASTTPGPPPGLRYDVTDGTSTLATNVAGLTTDLVVGAGFTPQVKARLGSWT